MKVINLNRREQVFAEAHFGLTLDFIKDSGLPYHQFRDVVRIGYLVAVKLYHEQGFFHRESFRAFAQWCMQTALRQARCDIIGGRGISYALMVERLLCECGRRNLQVPFNLQKKAQRKFSRIPNRYRLSHTHTFVPGYQPVAVGEVM